MSTAIWWIRRDLRLQDNAALAAAMQAAEQIMPLFIIDPFFDRSVNVGERRRSFLWAGLKALDDSLRQRG
ncbi:MAG: deoxyribodipyrimidine photo-lyase, partial [Anaerolineales bacterium]|nr:deoxyribodipyrimidine photo-lyase [Anaerolineales bacterium]